MRPATGPPATIVFSAESCSTRASVGRMTSWMNVLPLSDVGGGPVLT
jgi:hypothetical protein